MFVERVTVMYSVQDFLVFFSDSQLVAVKHFILRVVGKSTFFKKATNKHTWALQ